MSETGPPDAVKALAEILQAVSRAISEWLERWRPGFEQMAAAGRVRSGGTMPRWRPGFEQGSAVWWHPCHCLCSVAHPANEGVCEPVNAVTTRRFTTEQLGPVDVPLCAPCAVAQGVAELARDC